YDCPRHRGARGIAAAGCARKVMRAATPLPNGCYHDPRPAQSAGRPGRCRSGPGAGALCDATRPGGARDHPRPAPLSRTATEMSVTNMTRGAWCAIVAGAVVAIGGCKKGKAGGAAGLGGRAPMRMPVGVAGGRVDTVRDRHGATGDNEAVEAIELG